MLSGLHDGGVGTAGITTVPGPTGVAHIRVDSASGQNDIVIVPLANAALTPDLAERAPASGGPSGRRPAAAAGDPRGSTALRAAETGRELGMTVVLDPAPAMPLPEQIWSVVDVVTPNESEAAVLTGLPVTDVRSAIAAGQWFVDRGARTALVTLAEKGVVEVTADGSEHRSAPTVKVVDTTAAGDAFAGNLGAALAAGHPWEHALVRGIHAGALAVTVAGASTCLPTAAAVDALITATTRN